MIARLREAATLRRGLITGGAWGVSLTAALTPLSAWQCGGICIDETVWLASVSTATGILTIGPLEVLRRPRT
jgi:hypothetical protein